MHVSVKVQGLDSVKTHLMGLQKHLAYAASVALNNAAKRVAEAMPEELEKSLDRPTDFTKKGATVLRYANKQRLEVTVGFKRIQAGYLRWQIEGGVRDPGTRGLKLPGAIQVNEFGNIPKGIIAQLMAVAQGERKLGKAKARRIQVSQHVELFYGDPVDVKGRRYPRGIYKRVQAGVKSQLIPLVVFPQTGAHYKPRFDFQARAKEIFEHAWPGELEAAVVEAMRTAR